MSVTQVFRVAIRRDAGLQIKPEAEQIDGKIYTFRYGWQIEGDDRRYPGEVAWIPNDENYPVRTCPAWIASGDLKAVSLPVAPGQPDSDYSGGIAENRSEQT